MLVKPAAPDAAPDMSSAGQEFVAQNRAWNTEPADGSAQDTRPGGDEWAPTAGSSEPRNGGRYVVHAPSGAEPQTDNHPPEERAFWAARRRTFRGRLLGDARRLDPADTRRGYGAIVGEWADASGDGRSLRNNVTNVQPPNPGGINAEWAGVMVDPLQAAQLVRSPAVGDWWQP